MIRAGIYDYSNINFKADDLKSRIAPRNILLCSPKYFDIVDVKNDYMENRSIDPAKAQEQWDALVTIYESLKGRCIIDEVEIISGVPGLEDMVFAANQTFPWQQDGKRIVVLSNMTHESRQREISYYKKFFEAQSYNVLTLPDQFYFEGMGDAIPHPGKQCIYGGYGFRSDLGVYEELAKILSVPIVPLRLIDPKCYHLDTCFLPLDESTVCICEDAFNGSSLETIYKLFDNVIELPMSTVVQSFALNAHCIYDPVSPVAIIQKGSNVMPEILAKVGYEVIEVDTSEFMKSGGSVFCMKMEYY